MNNDIPRIYFESVNLISPSGQCDCDTGDCACSGIPSIRTQSWNQAFSSGVKLRINRNDRSMRIKNNFQVWYGPQHSPVVLNAAARKILFLFKDGRTADEVKARCPSSDDAIKELVESGLLVVDQKIEVQKETHQTLSAWLHITDRCNLRCEYCYLPHVKEDMSLETGYAAIDAVFRSAQAEGFFHIKLKYAGGEPLIKFENVLIFHRYAQQKSLETGISLKGIILSNGTLLTEQIAHSMKENNLGLMISLDGIGKAHDSHRPYLGGRGSFQDVQKAILVAKSYGIRPDISITVSGKTAQSVYKVVEWVLEQNLVFSLNFYRENELSVSHEDLVYAEEQMIKGLKKAYKVIKQNLPDRSLLNSLVDRANLSVAHSKTCSVGASYLVIDQKGQVSKCQMDMKRFLTDVHSENPLSVIKNDKTGIQNLPVFQKECNVCEWKDWCTGGCPLTTFRATGRYDLKSPNCKIYKAIYPEVIKLEGYRLLQRANISQLN